MLWLRFDRAGSTVGIAASGRPDKATHDLTGIGWNTRRAVSFRLTVYSMVDFPARARRHDDILAAAARLVDEGGYPAVTMEAVAKRAGAGKQTVYRWWPSKPALMVDTYLACVPSAELAPPPGPGLSAGAALTHLLAGLFAAYATTPAPAILAGLLGDLAHDPEGREALKAGLLGDRTAMIDAALARPGGPANPLLARETAVALVWYRVLMGGPYTAAMAARIAAAAIAAGAVGTEDRE